MEFLRLKKTKNSGSGGGGFGWFKPPSSPMFVFFSWDSPLLNDLNLNLGNIAYYGKFSKLGEKKCLIKQKKKKEILSKITAPHPTSSVSFEEFLSNKDESCIVQLFMSHAI